MRHVPRADGSLFLVVLAAGVLQGQTPAPEAPDREGSLKITVLSTMLGGDAHAGLGEWGYSALVEVDGRRLLFDTGDAPKSS